MTTLFIIKFILLSAICFIIVRYALSKNQNFTSKRLLLLVLPLLLFVSSYFEYNLFYIPADTLELLPEVIVGTKTELKKSNTINLSDIYVVGVIFFLTLRLIGIVRLSLIFGNAKKVTHNNKYGVYKTDEKINLSFGNKILINNNLTHQEEHTIINHENVHIANRHYLDLFLYNIYSIFFWFNPFIFLLHKELKLIHEFEVDSVIKPELNEENSYNGFGLAFINLASNYNFTNIKRRIEMRNTHNTSRTSLVLSLIAILLLSTSMMITTPELVFSAEKNNEEMKPPTYSGDLMSELAKELKYPKELAKKGVEGRTVISLTIGKDGEVKAHGITHTSGNTELDKEALRAALTLDKWVPAEKDGKKVTAITQIPIKFKLDKKKDK